MENYEIITFRENVRVNDVVTNWSYALAGFLVSMLFGVSPASRNLSHWR